MSVINSCEDAILRNRTGGQWLFRIGSFPEAQSHFGDCHGVKSDTMVRDSEKGVTGEQNVAARMNVKVQTEKRKVSENSSQWYSNTCLLAHK